jgi:hypothetical protein
VADQWLRDRFEKNPTAVLIGVIRDAGAPLSGAVIRQAQLLKDLVDALRDGGTEQADGSAHNEVRIQRVVERQLKIDGLRLLVELAGEMEFVAYNAGDPDIMVERVHLAVAKAGVKPIGAPGDEAPFTPDVHEPIGETPANGSMVTIVRPGYTWQAADELVVLQRAQVVLS